MCKTANAQKMYINVVFLKIQASATLLQAVKGPQWISGWNSMAEESTIQTKGFSYMENKNKGLTRSILALLQQDKSKGHVTEKELQLALMVKT